MNKSMDARTSVNNYTQCDIHNDSFRNKTKPNICKLIYSLTQNSVTSKYTRIVEHKAIKMDN